MDIVCLGELLIDMFPAEVGKRLAEVSAFRPKPGGAPANVAVSLARLGARSAFIGKVGQDAFGRHLADVLAQEGVETRGMRFDDQARTTMAFIASPDLQNNEYLFYRNPGADTRLTSQELDRELLDGTKGFHFGSLSLVEEPIRSAVLEAVAETRQAGGFISLDVNYRPTLWDGPQAAIREVSAVLSQIDVLKVNEDELVLLTGEEDLEVGSRELLERGPALCVVTLGSNGCFFRLPEGSGYIPPFDVKTVDATGCGDAFVSGLLARLVAAGPEKGDWRKRLFAERLEADLIYANAVGALTATKQGVIPSLPTAGAVDQFLGSSN